MTGGHVTIASPRLLPVEVTPQHQGVASVKVGGSHTCVLREKVGDGRDAHNAPTVICWGQGKNGQLGTGSCSNLLSPASQPSIEVVVCAPGTFGEGCEKCPGSNRDHRVESVCNAHGVCDEGLYGTGVCKCTDEYMGESCNNQCPPGFHYTVRVSGTTECLPCKAGLYSITDG